MNTLTWLTLIRYRLLPIFTVRFRFSLQNVCIVPFRGKWIKVPPQPLTAALDASYEVISGDTYWEKLQAIRHGWKVTFNLYGGDPDQPNGGPAGNWMGIRPVHCREVVAFFLNFTYMIDMQEHEDILRANEDRLYGNGGVTDKVSAETVLKQMRQPRSLRVGLGLYGKWSARAGRRRCVRGVSGCLAQPLYRYVCLRGDVSRTGARYGV